MAAKSTSPTRVVDDARRILQTIHDEVADGRQPYTSDIRRLVERSLALRFAEYIQFMERYGFLSLERRTDSLELTTAGRQVIDGSASRLKSMAGDAKYHFGDRLNDAPLHDTEATPAERFDDRYLKYERIGQGGLGSVWRGHHNTLDRPVALKLLTGFDEMFRPEQKEEARRRFELAVREHARLSSPFIAQIFDQNPRHDPPYFVLELAAGGNLRALLDEGKLAPSVALRFFIQMALGLRTAHAHGILHRDLKPSNVLLDTAGNVKMVDFGLTRVAERSNARRQAYVGYGSVGYMAPELFRRTGTSNPTIDVYALGILLYEMLTGELPGRRSPMPSALSEGVPADLDELFDQMTQDNAERRPSDMDAVLKAVWESESIVALLDARQAPLFVEAPTKLPGLPVPMIDPLAKMLAEQSNVEAPDQTDNSPGPVTEAPSAAPPPAESIEEPPAAAAARPSTPAPRAEPEPAPEADPEPTPAPAAVAPEHVEEPTPAVVSVPPVEFDAEPAVDETDDGIRAMAMADEDAPEVLVHLESEPAEPAAAQPVVARPVATRPSRSAGTQELNLSDLIEEAPEATPVPQSSVSRQIASRLARLKTSKT